MATFFNRGHRYLILIVQIYACFSSSTLLHSQINFADSSVTIKYKWQKGAAANYSVINTKAILNGADTTSLETSSFYAEVRVLETNDSISVLEWSAGNFTSDSKNPIVPKIMNALAVPKIKYSVDSNGVFKELLNWEELQFYYHSTIKALKQESPAIRQFFLSMPELEKMYDSKRNLETMGIREILQLHQFCGRHYQKDLVQHSSVKVPKALDSVGFDSDLDESLVEIDLKKKQYYVDATQLINQDQYTRFLRENTRKQLARFQIKYNKEDEVQTFKGGVITSTVFDFRNRTISSLQLKVYVADEIRVYDNSAVHLLDNSTN